MLRCAIVGLGHWGRTIVDAVQGKSTRVKITHAVSRNPAEHAAYAQQHGLMQTSSFDAVLADAAIDSVILATPHSLHAEQIIAAARAGKHVFCEKPLTLTRDDALRAVEACALANRVLMVAHDKRLSASMQALRAFVASGELGQLLHVEGHTSNENSARFQDGNWRVDPEESPGGGMTGAGVHMFDALIDIAGPLAQMHAQQTTYRTGGDPRDSISALFKFRSGVSGSFATVRATPYYWRVHVFGENASVEALGRTTLVIRRSGGKTEMQELKPVNGIAAEFDEFAQTVSAGKFTLEMGTNMIATVSAFESILRSLKEQQTVQVE